MASARYRALLDVVHDPLRARLAWLAVTALAVLMATSIWRRALRISYEAWHVLHSALGVLIVLAALGHAFLVDYYFSEPLVRLVWAVYGGGVPVAGGVGPAGQAAAAVAPPVARRRRPARAGRERHRRAGARAPARGPDVRLPGGQFAWILHGRTPFTPTYHPFSMSSSALRSRVEFTIKQVGGFTSSIGRLEVGDRVFMDGPHGGFTLERHPGSGYVFLAVGVGVTPFLSMLATLADQGDQRPCWLFLGNRHEDQITGLRQLEELQRRLNLTVVHVISSASEAWTGERGRIAARGARPAPAEPPPLAAVLHLRARGHRQLDGALAPRAARHGGPYSQRTIRIGLNDATTDDDDGDVGQLAHAVPLRALGRRGVSGCARRPGALPVGVSVGGVGGRVGCAGRSGAIGWSPVRRRPVHGAGTASRRSASAYATAS